MTSGIIYAVTLGCNAIGSQTAALFYLCGAHHYSKEHHDFLAFHSRANRNIGRGMKRGPQDIVATVVALCEWWQMDLSALQWRLHCNAEAIAAALSGLPCIKLEIVKVLSR